MNVYSRPQATISAFGILVLVCLTCGLGVGVQAQEPDIPSISWHPSGTMLALTTDSIVQIVSSDMTTILNEFPTGTLRSKPEVRVPAQWSPDGSRIAIFKENTNNDSLTIELWHAPWSQNQSTVVSTIPVFSWPNDFSWSPSGNNVAITVNESVLIADATTGTILRNFTGQWNTVTAIEWVAESRLALVGMGKLAGIIDPLTGQAVTSFYTSHTGLTTNIAIAFSPDGSRVAIGDTFGSIEIREDAQTPGIGQREIETLIYVPSQGMTQGDFPVEIPSYVLSLDWTDDGRYLASSNNDGTVRVWDPDTGDNLATLTVAPGAWIGSVEWRPNTLELGIGNPDGSVSVIVPPNVLPTSEPATSSRTPPTPTTHPH